MKKKFIILQVVVVFAMFMLVPLAVQKQSVKAVGVDTLVKVAAGAEAERIIIALGEKAGVKYATKTAQQTAIERWNLEASQVANDATRSAEKDNLVNFVNEANNATITPLPDKPGFGKVVISTVGFLTGLDMVYQGYQAFQTGINSMTAVPVLSDNSPLTNGEMYQDFRGVHITSLDMSNASYSSDYVNFNSFDTNFPVVYTSTAWGSLVSSDGFKILYMTGNNSGIVSPHVKLKNGTLGFLAGIGVTFNNDLTGVGGESKPLVTPPVPLTNMDPWLGASTIGAAAAASPQTAPDFTPLEQNMLPNQELVIPLDNTTWNNNTDFGNQVMADPISNPQVSPSPTPAPDPTDILGWLKKLWETLQSILDNLLKLLQNLGDWFASILAKLVSLLSLLQSLLDLLSPFITNIGNWFNSILNSLSNLPSLIASAFQTLFQSILSLLQSILSVLQNGAGTVSDVTASLLSNLFKTVTDLLNSIWTNIVNLPNTILTGIQNLFVPSVDPKVQFDPVLQQFKDKFNSPDDFAYLSNHVFSNQCVALQDIKITFFGQTMTIVNFDWIKSASAWWKPIMAGFMWFLFGWWSFRHVVGIFKRSDVN